MSYIALPPQVTAIPVPVADGGTNSTTALSNNRFVVSSSSKLVEASAVTASRCVVSDSNGLPTHSTVTSAQLLSVPVWTKYTVLYSDLTTAGTTNNITLLTLPLKTMIHHVAIKHSVAFTGGIISAYTLSVGITGTLAKYLAAFDVFQAVAATTFSASAATIKADLESFGGGIAIKVAAVSTTANLDAATAGSADIWVQTSLLP